MFQPRTVAILFVITTLFQGCNKPENRSVAASTQSAGAWFEHFQEGESRTLAFETEGRYLDTLGHRERNEQVRDWILTGLVTAYGRSPKDMASTLGAVQVRRVEDITAASQQRGAVRWCRLPNGDTMALIPEEDTLIRQRRLGTLLDTIRYESGVLEGNLHAFQYRIDSSVPSASVTRLTTEPIAKYFTPERGYYSAAITSAQELATFFEQVDDLTEARLAGGKLELAGRAGLLHDAGARFRVAHAAEVFQADAQWRIPRARINALVKEFNKKFGHFTGTAEEVARVRADSEKQEALIEDLKRREASRQDKRTVCGFSLDTKPEGAANPVYQEARYDCNLNGTEAGMVLFYADLTAKLWALDIAQDFPWPISGFQPQTAIPLSARDRAQVEREPWTRIWFGPRGDRIHSSADTLRFAPVATRVFAKSFAAPGTKEGQPNPSSAAFVGWWNAHYDEVARWEPEYGRLNEILKWSVLTTWLEDATEQSNVLDFLDAEPVTRTRWFPDWANQQGNRLAFQRWERTRFDPRGSRGRTESLGVLSSDPVVEGNYTRTIVGGVSLAAPSDVEASRVPPRGPPNKVTAGIGGYEAESEGRRTRFSGTPDKATIADTTGGSHDRIDVSTEAGRVLVKVSLDHSRPRGELLREIRRSKEVPVGDSLLADSVVDQVLRKGGDIFLHVPGEKGISKATEKIGLSGGEVALATPHGLETILLPGETLVIKNGGVTQRGFQGEVRARGPPPAGTPVELIAGDQHVPAIRDREGNLHLERDQIPKPVFEDPDLLRRLVASGGRPEPVVVPAGQAERKTGAAPGGKTLVLGGQDLARGEFIPLTQRPLTGKFLYRVSRLTESTRAGGEAPVYYEVRQLPEPDWDPSLWKVFSARSGDYTKPVSFDLPAEVQTTPWAIQMNGKTYVRATDAPPGTAVPKRVTLAYLRNK